MQITHLNYETRVTASQGIFRIVEDVSDTGIKFVGESDIVYGNGYDLQLNASDGLEESTDDIYGFQYREDFTASNNPITISINGSTETEVRLIGEDGMQRAFRLQEYIPFQLLLPDKIGIVLAPDRWKSTFTARNPAA